MMSAPDASFRKLARRVLIVPHSDSWPRLFPLALDPSTNRKPINPAKYICSYPGMSPKLSILTRREEQNFSFPLLQGRLLVAAGLPLPEAEKQGDTGRLNAYPKSNPSTIKCIWTIPAILRHQPVRLWGEWLDRSNTRFGITLCYNICNGAHCRNRLTSSIMHALSEPLPLGSKAPASETVRSSSL